MAPANGHEKFTPHPVKRFHGGQMLASSEGLWHRVAIKREWCGNTEVSMKLSLMALLLSTLVIPSLHAFEVDCVAKSGEHLQVLQEKKEDRFFITDFETDHPESSFDGNLMNPPTVSRGRLNMTFSNECDNMIDVLFSNKAANKFKAGKTSKLIGELRYSSAALEEIKDGLIVASIECTRK